MPKYELVTVKQLRNDKYQDGIAIVYYEPQFLVMILGFLMLNLEMWS